MHGRHGDGGHGGGELLALGGDHHRDGLVGPVDGDLLGHVVGVGTRQPRSAHEHQGLRRQVDVLLVLGGVTGDRLIAELGELDADLGGGDPVGTVADHRPRRSGGGVAGSGGGDVLTLGEHRLHGEGQAAQAVEDRRGPGTIGAPEGVGDALGQEEPGGHLGVEGLGRGDAHLDVTAVGGEQHPVGLLHQVAVAAVDDGHHRRSPSPHQVDGAIGVGRGPRLADGHDQRVGHVVVEGEARQLGGQHGLDAKARAAARPGDGRGHALPGDGGGALADDDHPGDGAVGQRLAHRHRQHLVAEDDAEAPGATLDAAPDGPGPRLRGFGELFEQVVTEGTPVDVAGGHLGGVDVVGAERQRRAVVGPAVQRLQPGAVTVEGDHLAPHPRGAEAGVAVHAHVHPGLPHHPIGLGGDHVGIVGQPHVEGLPTTSQREQEAVWRLGGAGGDGKRPVELGDGRAEGRFGAFPGGHPARHQGGHDLRVARDLDRDAQAVVAPQLAMVVDVPVDGDGDVGPSVTALALLLVVERVGVGLRHDAHTGPPGVAEDGDAGARSSQGAVQEVVGGDGLAQGPGVVAQLADLRRRLVHQAQAPQRGADRPRGEQGIITAGGDQLGDGGIGQIQAVPVDEQVQASRIASPHLEAVEGRQRRLHRGEAGDGGIAGAWPGEVGDGPGRRQSVLGDGPTDVPEPDQRGVDRLQGPSGQGEGAGVDLVVEVVDPDGQAVGDGGQLLGHVGVGHEEPGAGHPAQPGVEDLQGLGRPLDGLHRVLAVGKDRLRSRRQLANLSDRRGRPVARPADDGDDPAHATADYRGPAELPVTGNVGTAGSRLTFELPARRRGPGAR